MCVRSGCRDARMEMQFQRKWALRKRAQDRAVLVFFILSALLSEGGGLFYGHPHEASPSRMIQQIAFKSRDLNLKVCANCNVLIACIWRHASNAKAGRDSHCVWEKILC